MTNEIARGTSGIYVIRCLSNKKVYIGSSVDIARRFYLHKWELRRGDHHSALLQRAWNKYGEANFCFELVLLCDEQNLLMYEQTMLDFFESATPSKGMNICSVAGRTSNVKWTSEQRAKFIETKTGKPIFKNNPQAMANLLAAVHRGKDHHFYGKSHSAESRAAISKSKAGTTPWNKGGTHPKIAGIPRPEHVKRRISEVRQSRPESFAKLSFELVYQMRLIHRDEGASFSALGRQFGVEKGTARAAVLGKTWKQARFPE